MVEFYPKKDNNGLGVSSFDKDSFNSLTGELLNLIKMNGLIPDAADDTQVYKAIDTLIASYKISEPVTKTVASPTSVNPETFDFQSLHEALRWAQTLTFEKGGWLSLTLDDGTHVLGGQGEFDEWNWCYYAFTYAQMDITSIAGDKTNCIITLDAWDDGDNWPVLFNPSHSKFNINKVTIDLAAGGYPYSANADPLYIGGHGSCTLWNTLTKNYNAITVESGRLYSLESDYDNAGTAIQVLGIGALEYTKVNNITNSATGILIRGAARVYRNNTVVATSLAFLGNTQNTNVPLNEIQYSGGYISDGTAALAFKL